MAEKSLRIGLIGAGGNMRLRHIPGLRAIQGVDIAAVCNRRRESTEAAAREFAIPQTFSRWEDLVADPTLDAIVIGTWPYLHCPITLAALAAGKHVLTEARMSMNAAEARAMLVASRQHPNLVCQIVPSPFGFKGGAVMRELIAGGFLGELRQVQVTGFNGALADPKAPLSWRQDAELSGVNMLILGILHETLLRWGPPPVQVMAQTHSFSPDRTDPERGTRRPVGTPDSVQVLAVLEGGARAVYHLSGVVPFGQEQSISLYGSAGAIRYDLARDIIQATNRDHEWRDIAIPPEKAGGWRVESEFVESIREGKPVTLTDFETGVRYMEFTEAVARSAQSGTAIAISTVGK